ncbi:MAG: ABC transporter permease, partial [Nitrososphaeraceae archaeon]
MGDFGRFLVKRSLNMVIVLLSTLILTMALVGPTMDKILLDATRASVVEETNKSDIKFQDTEERQNYIDQRIDLQIKAIGLDEPWYSPKRFTNTVLKVMILDLG